MGAVLHLSKDDEELRRILKSPQVRRIQTVIETVQAPLHNFTYRDSQVFGMHLVLEWCDDNWKNTSLLIEAVWKLTITTQYVFTDSVLYLGGRRQEYPSPMKAWEKHRMLCANTRCREIHDLAGQLVQFDWRIFLGRTTTKITQEIKKMKAENKPSPSEIQVRIIFVSVCSDAERINVLTERSWRC